MDHPFAGEALPARIPDSEREFVSLGGVALNESRCKPWGVGLRVEPAANPGQVLIGNLS